MVKTLHKSILWILLIGIAVPAIAQKIVPPLPEDTLARVGSSIITSRDLIERIELMPWPEKEKSKHYDSSKVKALQSLVAERLLALEGEKYPTVNGDEVLKLKTEAMEKIFVRDELYRREVREKVRISEAEIRAGLARFEWELHIVAVALKDRAAADSLYRMLRKNSSLTVVLQKYPSSLVTIIDTVKVNFGALDTSFEKEVYAIGKKKFSKPFTTETYGWVIAVLLDRTTNPVCDKMTLDDRLVRVDETIRRRKETVLGNQYFAKILQPQKAKADSVVFEMSAKGLRDLLLHDSTAHKRKGYFAVISEDVDELLRIFSAELHTPFIAADEKPMTLGEVIESFRPGRYGFRSLQERQFKIDLNMIIRSVVELELMSREGYRQQLHRTKRVEHDLNLWARYWESRYFMWELAGTVQVTEAEEIDELIKSLPAIGRAYYVNVQEILCDSAAAAAQVLDDLGKGIPFGTVAKRYSIRKAWAAAAGISGYFPISEYPILGCTAMLADTGVVIGPVKLPEGYSIFRVLGKQKLAAGNYPSVDSVRINVHTNLMTNKRQQSLNRFIAGAANKYGVQLYYDKLHEVDIQPSNMFTRRYIGFGGVITASPLLYPNSEWVKEWQDAKKIIP